MSWATLMTHIPTRILSWDGNAIGGLIQVRNWRDPDLIENIREFRLSRRCRLDMLAASSSKRDPLQTFASHLLHPKADIQANSRSDPLLCYAGIERFRMDAP